MTVAPTRDKLASVLPYLLERAATLLQFYEVFKFLAPRDANAPLFDLAMINILALILQDNFAVKDVFALCSQHAQFANQDVRDVFALRKL